MKRSQLLLALATGAAAAIIGLAGCAGNSGSSNTGSGSGGGLSTPGAGGGSTQNAALATAQSASLGTIVTDSKGKTVYLYTKDTASPSTSNCSGQCAQNWPPVPASGGAVQGIDKSLVGSVTRADGTKQMTLNGWPLYEFAGDSASGDVNGQGKGGVWFAVTPSGAKATGSSSNSGGGSGGGGGGGNY
jgi:predicted lipoprotein with Yx(FWY)xxD motif